MTLLASGLAERLARLALAAISLLVFTSCGSGGVSGPAPVTDPTRITILPGTALAFSGLPTTFVISGGTGSYIVTSSNQAVIPVSGSIVGSSLTIVPNAVSAETTVTLTVRDTGATPTQMATVTVRPGTVANDITITPSSTQGLSCAPAICSGGDALVTATLSLGGVPLPGRGVRFEAVSGDFRFITSAPDASSETLDTSVTVVTDERGKASARIRALPAAANQTALLQVTDLVSQSFQRASFVIAQATGTSPGFFVIPETVTFQGIREDVCADSRVSASFFVFGGSPPYSIFSSSSAFFVSRDQVSFSGGSFIVTPNGQCVDEPGAPIIIRDASGRTVTATVINIRGTEAVPALVVAPDTVTLSSCASIATVTAIGGTGSYTANSGSGSVMVTPSPNRKTFSIQRKPATAGSTSPVSVGISDGASTVNVTVELTGNALGACPTPITANPPSVALTSCAAQTVTLSGGSGSYTASSSNASVRATVSSSTSTTSTLTIQRTPGSASFSPPATVTASDASDPAANVSISVGASGAGTGPCP